MKNLFAIPRLSLSETFTILITLVVCLVGFTNAEVYSNVRKRNPNEREKENFLLQKAPFRESVPNSPETPKLSKELEDKNFVSLRNFPESPLDRLFKRHSDYFGESDLSDSEKESDGYGYDDDEYYHFNFKRNDDSTKNNENVKSEKEAAVESQDKDAMKGDKYYRGSHKEGEKEDETIELIKFKESHINPATKTQSAKQFSDELHKKQHIAETGSSLKMSDIRENSAIDEKIKDGKDLGGGMVTDSNMVQSKNGLKSDDKDVAKLKDMKLTEDSEKKEKEPNLKDSKEGVSSNSLKDTSKASEGDKTVKLNDNVKLQESVDKMVVKNKEPSKVTKDEGEVSKYSEKITSDGLTDLSSRASFASNDYKDNADALKTAGADEEEKNSYEMGGMEKKSSLSDYQDLKQSRDRVRKQYTVRDNHADEILKAMSRRDDAENLRGASKTNNFLRSQSYETANMNPKELLKNSQFWKEVGLQDAKSRQQQQQHQQQQQQQQQQTAQQSFSEEQRQTSEARMMPQVQSQNDQTPNLVFDKGVKNPYGFNVDPVESGNINYYKNYLKSLKRYKGLSEDTKILSSNSPNPGTEEKTAFKGVERLVNEPHEANRRSMPTCVPSEAKEKTQIKYSNNKRDTQNNHFKQSNVHPRNYEQLSSTKTSKGGMRLSDGGNQEKQESSRLRRKSPQKLEYEIKVINQNKDENRGLDQLSHLALKRVEKDLKSKLATDDKYLKKYPYSQVSRDDLTRLSSLQELENYEKNNRMSRTVKRQDDKSYIQGRGVPSGYYGNRVKFGQKSYVRNNEKISCDRNHFDSNSMSSANEDERNQMQNPREIKDEDFKHDPMKRFDENGYLNKGNSLLLIKKDERTARTFDEGNRGQNPNCDFNSEAIAKILAKDSDFLVLKRTDSNKFQKYPETEGGSSTRLESGGFQFGKESSFGEGLEDLKSNVKETMLKKGLHARSFHSDKDDKKFTSSMHGTSSKSNLKKTFEKFRDLAGFFKDNEQESADNPVREVKEGRDIVFSEDKLPDPIVISNDPGDKYSALKPKPQNSIYSISTNFKALDQQDKKKELEGKFDNRNPMFVAQTKSENSQLSWEPALKSMFPEAKSINSTIRNGNEIIVLDLNRNQLKRDHGFRSLIKQPVKQPYAPFGSTAQLPVTTNQFPSNNMMPLSNGQLYIPTRGRVQIILDDGTSLERELLPTSQGRDKNLNREKSSNKVNEEDRAFAVFTNGDSHPQIILPSDINILSSLFRNILDKKDSLKAVTKKSVDSSPGNARSDDYNTFLKDLGELSELKERESRGRGFADKRNTNSEGPSSNQFQELSRDSESTIRYLGNLLENIMAKAEPKLKGGREQGYEQETFRQPEGSNAMYLENGMDGSLLHRWFGDENSRDSASAAQDAAEYFRGEDEEGMATLQSEGWVPMNEKNSEDELWEELAMASDKAHRARREGKGKQKQKRKAVERAVSFRERHQTASESKLSDSKSEGGLLRSDLNFLDSKQSEGNKNEVASRDPSDMKSGYENHLNEFIDGLSENKNEKEGLIIPNESTWSRKKRKDTRRRKRSTRSDVKNKVSTTAVQNTILKTLAEDNYHSVYSPGIKRRLLSTKTEAEDADSYSNANEGDKNVIAEEPQAKSVKNSLKKWVDPMIIEIFRDDEEAEKNRARRSLTSDFHSDFKRELDLDESMPNDFQNFLVTSLGAFGSQKREVVKKDEALGEGKGGFPDNYNQAVESGKEVREDSALEKREVSSDDGQKRSDYKKFFDSEAHTCTDVAQMNKAEKAMVGAEEKSKTSEVTKEKLPTHIRIQITNGSLKEKKSSKPIMEESEPTSSEMENFPKEKEFFEKSKVNSARKNNLAKFRQLSVSKYNYNTFDDSETQDNTVTEAPCRPLRRRFKKKKFTPDSEYGPLNDFYKLDQSSLESVPARTMPESNLMSEQTTQKSPVSNHLPQVDTVYTPTQGTNKAQLGSNKFIKSNSISSKNSAAAKSGLECGVRPASDDGISRSLLKEKTEKVKSDGIKDFEDWKPISSKMGMKQKLGFDAKNMNRGNVPYSTPYAYPYKQNNYWQRRNPGSSYIFHPFPKENISPNNLYDALKIRQEIKNREHQASKMLQKAYHHNNYFRGDDRPQPVLTNMPARSGSVNTYNSRDFSNKKPVMQGMNNWDYLGNGFQPHGQDNSKSKTFHTKKEEKYPIWDQARAATDGTKDQDYLDGTEGDYLDEQTKELQTSEEGAPGGLKKPNKEFDSVSSKNSDVDDGEDDDEFEEDYEENGEDDDTDDYSQFASTKAVDPFLGGAVYGGGQTQNYIHTKPAHTAAKYPSLTNNAPVLEDRQVDQTRYTKPKVSAKVNSVAQLMDIVNDADTVAASSSLLRKVNENSNIFGRNLLQNLYGPGNEDGLVSQNKLQQPELTKGMHFSHLSKLTARKLDPQTRLMDSLTGSRDFFAAKGNDFSGRNQPSNLGRFKAPRRSNYRLTKGHFLDAEFAGPGNDFENESDEKGKYLNEINFAKNVCSEKILNERDTDKKDDMEDVKENLEDDGETISEDNVLENVIGKYIMRKTVKSSTDQASKRSANKEKSHENDAVEHNLRKRSLEDSERIPKARVLRRRLSSGHLTENNFKKYHKKNLTGKRHVTDCDSLQEESDVPKTGKKRENDVQAKRSALDLLKKLTNKDKDKKADAEVDSKSAGFEPLSPLRDRKFQTPSDNFKDELFNQDKKISEEGLREQMKKALAESKWLDQNTGLRSNEPLIDKKKNGITIKDISSPRVQGPWKIELNDKCEAPDSYHSFKSFRKAYKVESSPDEESKSLKAFLVIGRNPKAAKRNSGEPLPVRNSELFLKEVGNRYEPNTEEGRGIYKKYARKRYSDVNEMEQTSSDRSAEEPEDRTLRHAESLSDGDSLQPPQGPEINPKSSFATPEDRLKSSPLLSNGRLVKRKSAYSPSNDANIIRESRHVKEETSEYLGQQVVNAILSHVSSNPKFKEIIAPGLASKPSTYEQETNDRDGTMQQVDPSEQMQHFLQRFMYDLEKLAERRVKKRMCNQIDKQAKEFLEFLLAASPENGKVKTSKENLFPYVLTTKDLADSDREVPFYGKSSSECTTKAPTPEHQIECTTKAPPEECMPECQEKTADMSGKPADCSSRDFQNEIDDLKKKCCLLLKLIVDYQKLSKLEKDILDMKFHNIMQQLEQLSQDVKGTKTNSCQDNDGNNQTPEDVCCGYKVEKNPRPKNCSHENESNTGFRTTTAKCKHKKPKTCQKKKIPKLFFEEMKNPQESDVSTTTCIPVFENVSVGKLSELQRSTNGKPHAQFEVVPSTPMVPQSYHLLLYHNNVTLKGSNPSTTTATTTTTHESIPCKSLISKSISCQEPAVATNNSQSMIMNTISAKYSGSDDPQSEHTKARKRRWKFASHLPAWRQKRSCWKTEDDFPKFESSTKSSDDYYEEEYKEWSSMPAIRRILNNLESGFEFDDLLFKKPKIKKLWRRGEKKPD